MTERIKMTETRQVSPDGFSVITFEKGKEYPKDQFPGDSLEKYLAQGAAEQAEGDSEKPPTVEEIQEQVSWIDSIDELNELLKTEQDRKKSRKGAIASITERIDELTEKEPVPEDSEPEE